MGDYGVRDSTCRGLQPEMWPHWGLRNHAVPEVVSHEETVPVRGAKFAWDIMQSAMVSHGEAVRKQKTDLEDTPKALAQISQRFGLGETWKGWLVFGDTWNDVEMLKWAEWSVCPSNAKDPRAKESAKEISGLTNDQAQSLLKKC